MKGYHIPIRAVEGKGMENMTFFDRKCLKFCFWGRKDVKVWEMGEGVEKAILHKESFRVGGIRH